MAVGKVSSASTKAASTAASATAPDAPQRAQSGKKASSKPSNSAPQHTSAPSSASAPAPSTQAVTAAYSGDKQRAIAAPAPAAHARPASGDSGGHQIHGVESTTVIPPAINDPRFVAGTTGPVVPEGKAKTVVIPDGPGFGGESGRKQNANDKAQNNYSVTDANFNNQLGLLAKDPDTGQPMTYGKDIQTYSAAGYIEAYAPEVYAGLAANQNAGRGTILGGAAHIMGLVQAADASEAGVDISKVPMTVPGTNLDARAQVKDLQDGTGQDWARMHHAESHWAVFKDLTAAGVDVQNAQKFSGDDAISGAGRINGVNNQDGASGLNAGELEVYQDAARYQQQTGIPVIFTMMNGHHMNTLDPSALTNPRINGQIGLAADNRDATLERANLIAAGLLSGAVHNNNNNNNRANNDNGGGGGGREPDVPLEAATAAGGGAVGTIDTQDPVAALTDIATTGFAAETADAMLARLSLLLQSLLTGLLDGTQTALTTDQIDGLDKVADSLTKSIDPKLQQLGKNIKTFVEQVRKNGGQLTPELQNFFAALTVASGQLGGNLDAILTKRLNPALLKALGIDSATLPNGGLVPSPKAAATDAAAGAAALGGATPVAETGADQALAGLQKISDAIAPPVAGATTVTTVVTTEAGRGLPAPTADAAAAVTTPVAGRGLPAPTADAAAGVTALTLSAGVMTDQSHAVAA